MLKSFSRPMILALAAASLLTGAAIAQPAPPAPSNPKAPEGAPAPRTFANIGLVNPECIRYDAANDRYLISNIGERGPGNNGFISIMTPDGVISNLKFIEGGQKGATLIDPLGMMVHNGTLYVADTTHLRRFDVNTGASKGDIALPGMGRPNDLYVAPDGTVYISDSGSATVPAGAIVKVTPQGAVSLFSPRDDSMERPNGVAVTADGHIVHGGRGVNLVFRDKAGKIVREQTMPTGQFDGIVPLADGTLIVASQQGRTILKVPGNPATAPSVLASDFSVPAAIGFDTKRGRVLVPQIALATITFVDLPK